MRTLDEVNKALLICRNLIGLLMSLIRLSCSLAKSLPPPAWAENPNFEKPGESQGNLGESLENATESWRVPRNS